MSNIRVPGVVIGPSWGGIVRAAVKTQYNPTFVREPPDDRLLLTQVCADAGDDVVYGSNGRVFFRHTSTHTNLPLKGTGRRGRSASN